MIRTIVGVIIGYIFFGAAVVSLFTITGRQTHEPATLEFAFIATVYGVVAAFLAGLIAAGIARREDMRASQATGALIAIAAIVSMFTIPAGGDRWSHIAALIAMAPSALLGGVYYRKLRKQFTSRPV